MGIIERIKTKLKNKEYAVFVDEKGFQSDIIQLNTEKKDFKYKKGRYIKDKEKFNTLQIKENKFLLGTVKKTYYVYDPQYTEPLRFTKNNIYHNYNREPYIAEAINTIFETKVLKDINQPKNNLFGELDSKKIFIGLIIIVGIIYAISGGI
jgi:hypothetical protein